jgi:hypothetical protein
MLYRDKKVVGVFVRFFVRRYIQENSLLSPFEFFLNFERL